MYSYLPTAFLSSPRSRPGSVCQLSGMVMTCSSHSFVLLSSVFGVIGETPVEVLEMLRG